MKHNNEEILALIKEFADRAHGEQVRKYIPHRYMVHPFRVMRRCRKYTDDITVLAAALLHDVIEDTHVTMDSLTAFLKTVTDSHTAGKIMNIVIELTDVYTESNFPFLSRQQRRTMEATRLEHVSKEAQMIKYADIMDNANEIVEFDPDFAMVYLNECMNILHKMVKGNLQLYHLAILKVHARLKRCKLLSGPKEKQQAELSVQY